MAAKPKPRVKDVVYVGNDKVASEIMKIGWGDYEGQIRIARVDSYFSKVSTGRWVSTSACDLLEPGDSLRATSDIEDASEDRRDILNASVWRFDRWDEDGDAVLLRGRELRVLFRHQLVDMALL